MDETVGVLGGGQLGRMLAEAANLLEIKVNFLDAPNSSAKQVSNHDGHIDGSFKDPDAITKLAAKSDVITIEIEHVDTKILEEIAKTVDVQPSWKTIRTIQDKYSQKEHLQSHGVATAQSMPLEEASVAELQRAAELLGLPFMLKSRREAYDGRGNFPVRTKEDFKPALDALGKNQLYAEKWADFKMELAVMVVKTKDEVLSFPTVETIHENSICKLVYAPARGVSPSINEKAQDLAKQAVSSFWGKGVFGVEMFLLADSTLLINEIAPRPHNSGHYTIEACPISQYEAHLRAILDLPLAQADLQLRSPAIMLNMLGDGGSATSHLAFAAEALKHAGAKIHLYGKGEAKKGRKMGHITVCAATMREAETIMQPLIAFADKTQGKPSPPPPQQQQLQNPAVAVLMGSDSDLPVLQPGLATLKALGIAYTTRITSAHRTPDAMAAYASRAAESGVRVLIAAAGGAAHLPGMAAAYTSLPVIGVPVKPSVGDGMDSLLSICNMPRGVPVATVGVNNSVNAALLAGRILGVADGAVRGRVEAYARRAAEEVSEKDAEMVRLGAGEYARMYLGNKK